MNRGKYTFSTDILSQTGQKKSAKHEKNGSVNEKNGSVNSEVGRVNIRLSIDSLSEFEKVIFLLIKNNENVNAKKICEVVQIPYRTTLRHLKTLKDKGLIEYVGSAKTGGYRITFSMS